MEDSDHAVVKQTEDKEDVIKAGKNYKEVVEGVLHVIWRENVDGECVPKETKHSNRSLNIELVFNIKFLLNRNACLGFIKFFPVSVK